ncbi:MAG: alpha/beta fold hydrolase [Verrucomicrobiota bacterium]
MRAKRSRFVRRSLWVSLTLLLIAIGGLVWMAWSLVSPPRRNLQDYHRQRLEHPGEHGIRIQSFSAAMGSIPALLVEPRPNGSPGKRGKVLRRQLEERGRSLPAHGTITGTLVLLHGRNGRKEDMLPVAERFCAAGFRCLLPDLPAHGESPIKKTRFGQAPFEAELPAALLEEAGKNFQFTTRPAGLWGISMGGSFATRATADAPDRWDGLVIVCSFDRLDLVIENQCRRRLGFLGEPAAVFVTSLAHRFGGPRYETVQPALWARSVTAPVLVAHGNADPLISLEQGRRLFDGFAQSRDSRWVEVDGGDHHDVLITPMPLYSIMADWFLEAFK